ncbi:helix-turn-helix domain-containing protein [Virgibacillus sp. DJP39]|uniref:helix-turn-helix domain-containing protein n=1 Tax=Virgibacillus sp. DJP39 TaxID=3409790 RepID=UPI003BB5DE40
MSNGDFYKLFGDYIRERRIKCGYTQEALALEMKVATSTLEKIERGESNPKHDTIWKLAITLKLDDIYNNYIEFWKIVHQPPSK